MALGYFEETIKLTSKTDAAWEKGIAIFDLLGWKYKTNGQDLIIAVAPMTAFGWGERITLSFKQENHLHVSSESRYPFQFIDGGKNRNNVEQFIEIFKKAKLPLDESEYAVAKNRSFL